MDPVTLGAAKADARKRYGNSTQGHVYNLKPKHLFRTRAKLAAVRAGTGTIKITTAGHSIVAGTGATIGTTDWPTQFKAALVAAGFPSSGTGLVAAARAGSSITVPADSRWSFGAGWTAFGQGSNLVTNSTNGNAATFTSDVAGTRVDVYYYNSSGAFTVSIDGGGAVAVTPPGGASLGTYTVTGLSNATHTVAISRTAGNCIFLGVEVWNGSTGIRLHNAGQSGQVTAVTGLSNTAWYASCVLAGAANGWNSDLAFLMCIANDAFASVPVATWQANMQTAITSLRANSQDVVLLVENPINALDFSAYTAAMYQLAITNDLPVIDFSQRWTSYTLANSYGIMSDGTHPNGVGYADYARAITLALGL
jgi:lysophospholipase L1-like esterase